MTDHPRFSKVSAEPDIAYRAYHGAALVSLVFRLVDAWRAYRREQAPGISELRIPARVDSMSRVSRS